jgi:hypothetical protein
MLKGSLSIPYNLAKLHPQLTRQDLAIIQALREKKEYDNWSILFADFLAEIGVQIPNEPSEV